MASSPTQRLLVYGFHTPERQLVVRGMVKDGFKLAGWVVPQNHLQEVATSWPGVPIVIIEQHGFSFPDLSPAYANGATDTHVIKSLSPYESTILAMMDRSPWARRGGINERLWRYYRLVFNCTAIIRQLEPDYVLMAQTPHDPVSFCFYAVCKALGITALMLKPSPLPGKTLAVVGSFESSSQTVSHCRDEALTKDGGETNIELSEGTESYLAQLKQDYAVAMPAYMRGGRWTKIRGRKKSNFLLSAAGLARGWVLEQIYERNAAKFAPKTPYVFVALHYQPERTTHPEAGLFAQQLLMVKMLSTTLPEGWHIYVKEHPTQFILGGGRQGDLFRGKEFYAELRAIPHVDLISTHTTTFDCVDNAEAVATCTGTVGLEAVVRGKPVLAFGHPNYEDCEGVFIIDDYSSCCEALRQIEKGYRVDEQKLRAYFQAVEATAVSIRPPADARSTAPQLAELILRELRIVHQRKESTIPLADALDETCR